MNRVIIGLQYGAAPLSVALERANEFVMRCADDPPGLGEALVNRGSVNVWLGRPGEAEADLAGHRAICDELCLPYSLFDPLGKGYGIWLRQRPSDAEPVFAQAHETIRSRGELLVSDFTGVPLARIRLELGRTADAALILDDLRENPAVVEARIQERSMRAVVTARAGDLNEAFRLSTEAEAIAASTDCLIEQADVALDRAEILLLAGRRDEARASAEQALERFERKEYAIGIRRARRFLATLPG